MSNPDNMTPATDAVKALHLFLSGAEDDGGQRPCPSPDAITRELKAAGIDVDKMETQIRKRIAQARNRLRLQEIREAKIPCGEQVSETLLRTGRSIDSIKEQIKQAIGQLVGGAPELAQVYYRRLEDSTEEDLTSLLSDLNELNSRTGDDETEDRR